MSTNLSSKRIELAEPVNNLDAKEPKVDEINQSVVTEPNSEQVQPVEKTDEVE